MVTLEYLGSVFGRFPGRVTGYQYNFKRRFKMRPVDSRDAECFLEYKDAEGRPLFRDVSKIQSDIAEESDVHEGASDLGEEDAVSSETVDERPAETDPDLEDESELPDAGDGIESAD